MLVFLECHEYSKCCVLSFEPKLGANGVELKERKYGPFIIVLKWISYVSSGFLY